MRLPHRALSVVLAAYLLVGCGSDGHDDETRTPESAASTSSPAETEVPTSSAIIGGDQVFGVTTTSNMLTDPTFESTTSLVPPAVDGALLLGWWKVQDPAENSAPYETQSITYLHFVSTRRSNANEQAGTPAIGGMRLQIFDHNCMGRLSGRVKISGDTLVTDLQPMVYAYTPDRCTTDQASLADSVWLQDCFAAGCPFDLKDGQLRIDDPVTSRSATFLPTSDPVE